MAKAHETAPHEFPLWPMNCLAFYNHAMRDFGRYAQAMTKCSDPMQAVRAEGDYGVRMWRDALQAYYDFAILPMTLAAQAAARAPVVQPDEEQPHAAAE